MKEERKKYERPSMKRNLVELEDGFCVASVAESTKTGSVKTTGHELNKIDVTGEDWNSLQNTGSGAGSNGWE
jgi:hypothetical protein